MSIKLELTDCDMLGMQLMDFQEAYLMSKKLGASTAEEMFTNIELHKAKPIEERSNKKKRGLHLLLT